jgi:excisionase family DNA binding protein
MSPSPGPVARDTRDFSQGVDGMAPGQEKPPDLPPWNGEPLMRVPAAAERAGLSRSNLWRMIRRRRLAALVLPGNLLRVTWGAVAGRRPHSRTSALRHLAWWLRSGRSFEKVACPPQPEVRMDSPTLQPAPLLTVEKAAEWAAVHPKTVRKWLRDGTLPAVRIGRTVRVPLADLLDLPVPYVPPRRG